jgi:hypothetical protein
MDGKIKNQRMTTSRRVRTSYVQIGKMLKIIKSVGAGGEMTKMRVGTMKVDITRKSTMIK